MINTNEQAPDMERLGREEFILDMEEHDRLEAEEKELIQQVYTSQIDRFSWHNVYIHVYTSIGERRD